MKKFTELSEGDTIYWFRYNPLNLTTAQSVSDIIDNAINSGVVRSVNSFTDFNPYSDLLTTEIRVDDKIFKFDCIYKDTLAECLTSVDHASSKFNILDITYYIFTDYNNACNDYKKRKKYISDKLKERIKICQTMLSEL